MLFDRIAVSALRAVSRRRSGATITTFTDRESRVWRVSHTEPDYRDPGVPIVFVHGFGNDGSTWYPFFRVFRAARELAAIDLPGFGETPLDTDEIPSPTWYARRLGVLVGDLITRWGQPPILVAKSMGAVPAGILASESPHLVRAVVLVAPAGLHAPNESEYWRTYRASGRNLLLPRTVDEFSDLVDFLYYGRVRIPKYIQRAAIDEISIRRAMWERIFSGLLSEGMNPLGDRLAAIDVPLAVVFGASDRIVDPSSRLIVEREKTDARIVTVAACGHSPTRERPDVVIDEIFTTLTRYG
jgi:pimeloyl-ACP methyl ester carboxylesterase